MIGRLPHFPIESLFAALRPCRRHTRPIAVTFCTLRQQTQDGSVNKKKKKPHAVNRYVRGLQFFYSHVSLRFQWPALENAHFLRHHTVPAITYEGLPSYSDVGLVKFLKFWTDLCSRLINEKSAYITSLFPAIFAVSWVALKVRA